MQKIQLKNVFYVFPFLAILFCLTIVSAEVGVSPAKVDINYVPNEEYEVFFSFFSDTPENELEIYVDGDSEFIDLVTLDKDTLTGSGKVKASFALPSSVERPGRHRVVIGAREKAKDGEFLGATINIRGAIDIHVPFPGRYVEGDLTIDHANTNDKTPAELKLNNLGKEDLTVTAIVKILNEEGEQIHSLNYGTFPLATSEEKKITKILLTTDFKPGNYNGRAEIDFGGDQVIIEDDFRVGSLFINITNFSSSVLQGGVRSVFVEIESQWNAQINNVYADIIVKPESGEKQTVRTPSVTLNKWEITRLEGFINTDELPLGEYDIDVEVHYETVQTDATGKLSLVKEKKEMESNILYYVIGGIIILLLIYFFYLKSKLSRGNEVGTKANGKKKKK